VKPVKSIVLAGGELDESFIAKGEKASNKNFLEISGKPMVEYVIEALKASSLIEEIIIAAPPQAVTDNMKNGNTIVKSGSTIVETVLNGLSHLPHDISSVLIVMADLPLLTPESIDDFIRRCNEIDGEYYYSILEKSISEKKYPGLYHTYVKLKEGIFCGGGLILMNPGIVTPCRCSLMDKLLQERKKPFEMAKLLGVTTLLKLLCRQASIDDLLKRTSEVFNCVTRTIVTPYAEIGMNVDRPEELKLVRSIIHH
jgi:GTP:adenosylcobinamide-phosphate guanylyltransferase